MLESKVKEHLIAKLEARGWWTLLLIQTNKPGIPDVLAISPNRKVVFIEVKQEGKDARKLQKFVMKQLTKFGVPCIVWDGTNKLEEILNYGS